jgi:hypothetical protein
MNLVGAGTILLVLILQLRRYIMSRDRQVGILILGWSALFLFFATEAISYMYNLKELWRWHNLFLFATGYAVLFWVDYITRDSIEPIKTGLFSLIVGLALHALSDPDSVRSYTYSNGDPSFGMQGDLIFWVLGANIFMAFWWLLVTAKILRNSPSYLKSHSIVLFVAAIFFSLVPQILVGFRLTTLIPGIDTIPLVTGILITTIVMIKKPQLGYILPFKALKLAVVSSSNSFLLFLHKWHKVDDEILTQEDVKAEELDDSLFSGMLYGISLFIRQTIQRGEVKEVFTDDAVLMVHHHKEHPVLFVLLATNATKSLRNAFKVFINQFIAAYSQSFYSLYDQSDFQTANELINHIFPFIPYDDTPYSQKILSDQEKSSSKSHQPEIGNAAAICVSCKNIKAQNGGWGVMDEFIRKELKKQLSWGMCSSCQEKNHYLSLSFFDQILGPRVLLAFPDVKNKIFTEIPNILDLGNNGYFLHTNKRDIIANYVFKVNSPKSRGGTVPLLLSYIHQSGDFNQEFSEQFLQHLAKEILNIKNIAKVFISGKEIDTLIEFQQLQRVIKTQFLLIQEKIIQFFLNRQLIRSKSISELDSDQK